MAKIRQKAYTKKIERLPRPFSRSEMENDKTLPKFKDTPADEEDRVAVEKTYVTAITGPHTGTVFTVQDGTMVAGRHPSCEIYLNDSQVSRRHTKFVSQRGKTSVIDLGSTNGTFLNGARLESEQPLSDEDEVQIGATCFRYSIQNPIDGNRLGLRNHSYFEARLHEELDRASRYKRPLSILQIGPKIDPKETVEQEKAVRSHYPTIVEYMKKIIRTMDLLAHFGKFELEVLLAETGKTEALALAERITKETSSDKEVLLSVGVATFPEDGRTADILVEKSRQALRRARSGEEKGRVVESKDEVRRIMVRNKEVIVKSEKMSQLFELAERIAKSTITVLIQGETGVGKEVVAEAIHFNSDRSAKALVCINCAALTETLLESELFGHEKGSFTGADHTKIGLFESAKGGTIFLDEVGEMPAKTQAKLLRVLQSKKIMRVGSNREIDTDVRVVTATNRKLEELVAGREFREDLYYRLNAATIVVPPLRERKEEIPYLVQAFIEEFCKENRFPTRQISPDALDLLCRYHWPGNIRELRNAIERAVVISEGDIIHKDALTGRVTSESFEYMESSPAIGEEVMTVASTAVGDMKDVVAAYERDIIINALKRSEWNQTKAAELLNVPRRTLVSKIKKYGIRRG